MTQQALTFAAALPVVGTRVRVAVPAAKAGQWNATALSYLQGTVGTVERVRDQVDPVCPEHRVLVVFDAPIERGPEHGGGEMTGHWFDVDEIEAAP